MKIYQIVIFIGCTRFEVFAESKTMNISNWIYANTIKRSLRDFNSSDYARSRLWLLKEFKITFCSTLRHKMIIDPSD